jgi:D-alanyl-lipoteichoic acid acyltransferase DltB (MBOAT superfamily)
MQLGQILIFGVFALLAGSLASLPWRRRALLLGSLLGIFWLQPSTTIRNLDFWLPFISIALTVWVWMVTQSRQPAERRALWVSVALIVGSITAVGLTRYAGGMCCLTPTRPPEIWIILIGLAISGLVCWLIYRLANKAWVAGSAILVIILLFILLKTESLTILASAGLRNLTGQSPGLASALDIPWLGFSYLSFRLLHVLRDFQAGKLPVFTLEEFAVYALFFPAFTAGPIDRAPRFIGDLRAHDSANPTAPAHQPATLIIAARRVLTGIFYKFVLADSLALIALNPQNAAQVHSAGWAWILLYAYALRIFFDFAGYTEIAIGLGRLAGIQLPENFERPYFKTNLTTFWNSWHITLAQWLRAYVFNPFTRALRTRLQKLPTWAIILLGQLVTMLLIGLWHGVTWNFAIWGAWHGLGLFVHNRWAEWLRPRLAQPAPGTMHNHLLQASGWLLTFHYVTLGWVWFALPDPANSQKVIAALFGL